MAHLDPPPHVALDASCCSQTTSCLQHPEGCLSLICSFPSLLVNVSGSVSRVCLGHNQRRKVEKFDSETEKNKTPETKMSRHHDGFFNCTAIMYIRLNFKSPTSVFFFFTSASDTVQQLQRCCWPQTGFLSCFCLTHRQERRGGKNHKRGRKKEKRGGVRADEKDPY